ncbi:MFS transporter [Streptomyces sp. NPDC008317]|uniref:MFS transporter n=1 Tax=Streptomyces sp. NPDC008317 TaxID=3364827 RepID=UPI0036EAF13C
MSGQEAAGTAGTAEATETAGRAGTAGTAGTAERVERAADPVAPPAYRDANVLRWLTAYTASVTGDLLYFLALTWAATRVAGPSQVGLVIAAGALPRAVLMLGGGAVADRFGPRKIAVASDATRCAVILAAALMLVATTPGLWLLVPVALVFGVVDAVFMPAVGALPPRITTHDQLARVNGMRGLSIRLSNAVGPLLAGVVLAAGGAAGAFTAAGVLFAASLALLLTVRTAEPVAVRESERPSLLRESAEGLRYIRRHALLGPLVVVVGLSEMCFSGPVAAGLVLLADERGWGASGMGWVASAFSVGAAGAAMLLTVGSGPPRAGLVMFCALLLTAAGTAALGYAPTLASAVVLGAVVGVGSGLTSTLTGALVQTVTEPRYLGRVTAVTTLCALGLAPVLFPAVGLTVAAWGSGVLFAAFAAVCLLAAVVALASTTLRRVGLGTPHGV